MGRARRVVQIARRLSPLGRGLKGSAQATEDVLSNDAWIAFQQQSLQLPLHPRRHLGPTQKCQPGLQSAWWPAGEEEYHPLSWWRCMGCAPFLRAHAQQWLAGVERHMGLPCLLQAMDPVTSQAKAVQSHSPHLTRERACLLEPAGVAE